MRLLNFGLKKMRAILIVSMIASCLPVKVHAAFVEDRNEWLDLPDPQRQGFVMGAIDGLFYVVTGDSNQDTYRANVRECLKALDFNSLNGAELITQEYEQVENWSLGALVVLLRGVNKACHSYIS